MYRLSAKSDEESHPTATIRVAQDLYRQLKNVEEISRLRQ